MKGYYGFDCKCRWKCEGDLRKVNMLIKLHYKKCNICTTNFALDPIYQDKHEMKVEQKKTKRPVEQSQYL